MTKKNIYAIVGVTVIVVVILSYIAISGINHDVNQTQLIEDSQVDQITETILPKGDKIIAAALTTVTPVEEKLKTSSSTILVTQKFYRHDEKTIEEEGGMPFYLTGITEDELFDYTKNYLRNPNLNDRNHNIVDYKIELFTNEKVILKKTYDSINTQAYYYVTITDDYIAIYENDKETLKELTSINVEQLNYEIVTLLLDGVMVYGEQGIIELLENFTS